MGATTIVQGALLGLSGILILQLQGFHHFVLGNNPVIIYSKLRLGVMYMGGFCPNFPVLQVCQGLSFLLFRAESKSRKIPVNTEKPRQSLLPWSCIAPDKRKQNCIHQGTLLQVRNFFLQLTSVIPMKGEQMVPAAPIATAIPFTVLLE